MTQEKGFRKFAIKDVLYIRNLGALINVQFNNFPNVLKLYHFEQFNNNNNNNGQLVQNNL